MVELSDTGLDSPAGYPFVSDLDSVPEAYYQPFPLIKINSYQPSTISTCDGSVTFDPRHLILSYNYSRALLAFGEVELWLLERYFHI